MKRFYSRHTCWLALVVSSLTVAGCDSALQTVLPSPTAAPTPTTVPTAKPDVFDPADGITPNLTKLNDSDPANPAQPDKFRVARVDTGDLVWIQSVSTRPVGKPPKPTKVYGPRPDIARLAGIFVPAPGQPGWADTVAKVQKWTLGQEVDVEQDPKYPTDLNARRMVQIFFNGREGKTKDVRLNLNRMLVRLGYAVVDLHAATSIDVKPWLNDEQYARNHRLGLWGKGIILYQRIPLPAPKGSKLQIQRVGVKNQITKTRTRLRQNITTSTNNVSTGGPPPGARPPSGPPPGSSMPQGPPPGSRPPSGPPPGAGASERMPPQEAAKPTAP